jgi:hypothetical protein
MNLVILALLSCILCTNITSITDIEDVPNALKRKRDDEPEERPNYLKVKVRRPFYETEEGEAELEEGFEIPTITVSPPPEYLSPVTEYEVEMQRARSVDEFYDREWGSAGSTDGDSARTLGTFLNDRMRTIFEEIRENNIEYLRSRSGLSDVYDMMDNDSETEMALSNTESLLQADNEWEQSDYQFEGREMDDLLNSEFWAQREQ